MLAGLNKALGKAESEKKSSFSLTSVKKSMGISEPERKSVIDLGSMGEKLKAGGNKLAAGEMPTFTEESAFSKCCPNLTMTQRIIGFFACASFGWVMSLLGTLVLIGGPSPRNITTFAVLYVVGNVIALCATGFLLGPKTQCNKMWHSKRRYSTAFYLIMLIVVFAVAVAKQNVGIVIALLVIEVMAATWYALSYVPFGRKVVLMFLRRTICKPCCLVYDSVKGNGGAGGGSSSGGSGGGLASQV